MPLSFSVPTKELSNIGCASAIVCTQTYGIYKEMHK